MPNINKSFLSATFSSLALALATSGAAQAIPVVTVEVNGKSYDVTYFVGKYDNNSTAFQAPPSGQMPWWGNQSLATSFAQQVGNKVGTPNEGGSPLYGFGLGTYIGGPSVQAEYFYNSTLGYGDFGTTTTWAYATATLITPPVPGPLPLFGAAAAFGMTRRLRRRIQLRG